MKIGMDGLAKFFDVPLISFTNFNEGRSARPLRGSQPGIYYAPRPRSRPLGRDIRRLQFVIRATSKPLLILSSASKWRPTGGTVPPLSPRFQVPRGWMFIGAKGERGVLV